MIVVVTVLLIALAVLLFDSLHADLPPAICDRVPDLVFGWVQQLVRPAQVAIAILIVAYLIALVELLAGSGAASC